MRIKSWKFERSMTIKVYQPESPNFVFESQDCHIGVIERGVNTSHIKEGGREGGSTFYGHSVSFY